MVSSFISSTWKPAIAGPNASSPLSTPRFFCAAFSLQGNILPTKKSRTSRQKSIIVRSEEHTSELQSRFDLVCRLLLEKKNSNRLVHGPCPSPPALSPPILHRVP